MNPRLNTRPSPLLDNLAERFAKLPWWIIIIVVGLVIVFYSFMTSDLYRTILGWVTDSPQITTNRFARVRYEVRTPDGGTQIVRGTLIAEDSTTVTIETQPEQNVTVADEGIAAFTCNGTTDVSAQDCLIGATVTVSRDYIAGSLQQEDTGRFRMVTDQGNAVEVLKIGVVEQVRIPENCARDTEGGCRLELTLNPQDSSNIFTGTLTEQGGGSITVQTAAAEFATVNRADIVQVVASTPDVCALNNLSACNEGIFLTFIAAILAFVVSVIIGLIFSLMRISNNIVLNTVATVYVEVVRGIPIIVILLIFGFGLFPLLRRQFPPVAPTLAFFVIVIGVALVAYFAYRGRGIRLVDPAGFLQPIIAVILIALLTLGLVAFLGTENNLRALQAAIAGLAFAYGAFLAELFRAGIQSIPRGQMEASRSLGMTYVAAMRYVILPQAFRVILPPLGNEFIAILKDTSLIAILALPDMTQMARLYATDTYRPFEPYLTIAVLYLCMTLFLSFMVRVVERRVSIPR